MDEQWYAVGVCYEPDEGVFPDSIRKDLLDTTTEPWIFRSKQTFPSKQEALQWAYDNEEDEKYSEIKGWVPKGD